MNCRRRNKRIINFYKFPGDKTPIIKGSALAAVGYKDEEIGKKAIMDLMKAVDEHIPQPDRPKDKPFLMPVEDVFQFQEEELLLLVELSRVSLKLVKK